MKHFPFIIFWLLAYHTYSQTPQTLKILDALENRKEEKLSLIGNHIRYIHLETTPNSLLSEIAKIIIDDNIYIKTKEGLFVFSIDGKFIKKIGIQGKGPNEYLSLVDFDVNKENIWTLDVLLHKVFKYKKDGGFIASYKYSKPVDKLFVTNSQYFLLTSTPPDFWGEEDLGTLIYTFTLEGKPLSNIKNTNSRNSSACTNSFKFNDNLNYRPILNDTVFALSNNKIQPKYVIDLGKYKPTKAIYGRNENVKTINCKRIEETDKFLFLLIKESDGTQSNLVYNKISKTIATIGKTGFVNDLDDGISFWPDYICNSKLIKIIDYNDMSSYTNEKKAKGSFNEKMDINSNPILMVISQ